MNLVKRADNPALRDAIFRLEDKLKDMPQAEIEVIHRFAPGVYTREMIVPAGTLMTGMIHKTEHISIFLEGRMIIPHEGGSKEIVAPMVENALPGVKRVGLALERVRWITVHPTEETDIKALETLLVTNDPNEVKQLRDMQ